MEIRIDFSDRAMNDIEFWKKSGNVKIQKRISILIDSMCKTPFQGIGKPEPLKYNMQGKWSRRINHEHRLVYSYKNDIITIYSLRFHYD